MIIHSVADILGCITNIYQTQGDLNNALQTTKEEVMYLKIPLGNNNPDLAPAMEKIAVLQFKNSKFNDALCSFKEVVSMFSCSHKIIIFCHSTQLDCQQLNTTSF